MSAADAAAEAATPSASKRASAHDALLLTVRIDAIILHRTGL
jgi:hypothetical protein